MRNNKVAVVSNLKTKENLVTFLTEMSVSRFLNHFSFNIETKHFRHTVCTAVYLFISLICAFIPFTLFRHKTNGLFQSKDHKNKKLEYLAVFKKKRKIVKLNRFGG